MGVSIVKIDASNAGLLERVAADVFDGPLEPGRLGVFLGDGQHILIVAMEEDGLVVGQASGAEYLHPDKPPQFFFNEVGVSPDWTSRGIGRRLSAAIIDEARARIRVHLAGLRPQQHACAPLFRGGAGWRAASDMPDLCLGFHRLSRLRVFRRRSTPPSRERCPGSKPG